MRGIRHRILGRLSGSAISEPDSPSITSSSSPTPPLASGESDLDDFTVASKTNPISITRKIPKAESVVQSPTSGSITIVKSPHIRTISATPGARSPASPFKFFSKNKIITYRPKPYNMVHPPKQGEGSKQEGGGEGGKPSKLTDYSKMFGTDIDDFAVRLPFGPKETLSFESVNPKEWKTPPRTDTHTKISKRVNKNKQNKTKQNKTNKIITSVYIYIYIYIYIYVFILFNFFQRNIT